MQDWIQSRWLLLVWLIFVVALASGLTSLTFRGDYKIYFKADNPERVSFEEMQSVFSRSDNVTFTVITEEDSVFNEDTLLLLHALTDAAWHIPLSTRVDSIANYQHTYAIEDDMIVEDLIYRPDISPPDPEKIKRVVMDAPELWGRVVSRTGKAASVDVTVQLPDDQTEAVIEVTQASKAIVAEMKQRFPGHKIVLTGIVIMNDAFAQEAQKDASTLVPGMFIVIALAIALFTRSLLAMCVTMLVVVVSIVSTMGLSGWLGHYLSTATVNVPTIVTTLAVADCIHLIIGIRFGMQHGMTKHDAIQYSLKLNIKPIFITSITTALGFLTLNFSEVPVLADLGNLTAFGVMAACILSLSIVTILYGWLPVSYSKTSGDAHPLYAKAANAVCNNYQKILPISLAVFVLFGFLASQNRLNDVVVHYFDESNTFRQAVDQHEKQYGGMSTVDFMLKTDVTSGINKPEFLVLVEVFARWLREQPEVHHVMSFSDTFKRLNKNMNNDEQAFYALPDNQDLAAQYLLLYEMSLPYGLDVNNQVDIDKSAIRLIATMSNMGSQEFTEFEQRSRAFFSELNNQVGGSYELEAASPALMFAHIGETNMRSMVWGALVALIMISALLMYALRSMRLGAISIMPNLLPALVGFGIWGQISGQVNLALSVVLSMTMGIIVDDTVHFLAKYQHARKEGKSAHESIEYAFKSVASALLITTAVLSAGFGVLTLSSFALNSHMGLLTVIIVISAIVIDLLFLPAFLMWLDRKESTKQKLNIEPNNQAG